MLKPIARGSGSSNQDNQKWPPRAKQRRVHHASAVDAFSFDDAKTPLEGSFMSLLNLIITIVVVGLLLWLINRYIPMEGRIKQILNVVVIIALVLWLLNAFGVLSGLSTIRIGN